MRARVRHCRIEAALHGAHAMDLIKSLPEGLRRGRRSGGSAFGGERQRIAIARALLHNPEILILDEVMSALDPLSEQKVQEALRSLCTQRTVLLIAHRLSSLRDADHVLVFQHGRIVESGSPPDLLKRGRYYRTFTRHLSANLLLDHECFRNHPTHNRPASCTRLLAALMPQVLSWNFDGRVEVIIVDDHSSHLNNKHLIEKLRRYPDGSVRLISRESSGGPSAARNSGIMKAGAIFWYFSTMTAYRATAF